MKEERERRRRALDRDVPFSAKDLALFRIRQAMGHLVVIASDATVDFRVYLRLPTSKKQETRES